MLALILYLARASCAAYQNNTLIINSFKSNPLQFFTFIIACGGTLALVVPSTMNIFKLIGDSAPLTTAMLGITGGIIAVFGIIKTHQKNLLDEENLKLEREKYAKSIADKEKEIKRQESTRRSEKKQFQKSMKQQKYQFEKISNSRLLHLTNKRNSSTIASRFNLIKMLKIMPVRYMKIVAVATLKQSTNLQERKLQSV